MDWVRILDTTQQWSSDWIFNNQMTDLHKPSVFGTANAGDNIVVEMCVVPIWENDGKCKGNDNIYASEPLTQP